jgi:hypothetical protein
MRIVTFIMIIALLTLCSGCRKKSEIVEIIKTTEKDITNVSLFVSTEEETDYLTVYNKEGVKEILELLHNIKITKKLDIAQAEEPSYYDYQVYFGDDTSLRVTDYKDKLKIVDRKGKINWYEVEENTWEVLTPIWQKYYVENTKANVTTFNTDKIVLKKPIIYLYPTEPTNISVELDLKGELTYTYPYYQGRWSVFANPDGSLTNILDGKTYSYLFWEGKVDAEFDLSKGFVVKGSDTTKFLEEKLSTLGLSDKELNDFIVFWAPVMSENNYNLITFQQSDYTKVAKLKIKPEPDGILRVFMVYKPLKEYIDLPEQELNSWVRSGFSVVEWGGAEVTD